MDELYSGLMVDVFDNFTTEAVYEKRATEVIALIRSYTPEARKLLELACGTGNFTKQLARAGFEIIATDISADMIQIANKKLLKSKIRNIDFQIQDSYNLTFPDKSFDIVIASNLLHLLYEPEKPIKEIKRVMKDNGIFIAPTLCFGENTKSKITATIIGFISGFKVVNKWSFQGFKSMLTNNGLVICKALRIEGKLLTAYIVLKK